MLSATGTTFGISTPRISSEPPTIEIGDVYLGSAPSGAILLFFMHLNDSLCLPSIAVLIRWSMRKQAVFAACTIASRRSINLPACSLPVEESSMISTNSSAGCSHGSRGHSSVPASPYVNVISMRMMLHIAVYSYFAKNIWQRINFLVIVCLSDADCVIERS